MQRVLGIETSSERGSVAIVQGERVLAHVHHDEPNQHAERLPELARRVLALAGVDKGDLTRIAVGVGPGTFTGIRIGIAWAHGLGLGLRIETVGVSSLAALAASLPPTDERLRLVVRDARRSECFVAAYDPSGLEVAPPRVLARETLSQELVAIASGRPYVVVGEQVPGLPHAVGEGQGFPDAATVARLGATLRLEEHRPVANYVRGPGADPQALVRSPLLGPRV